MKRIVFLFLAALLLSGCTTNRPAETPAVTEAPAIAEAPVVTSAPAATAEPAAAQATADPIAMQFHFQTVDLKGNAVDETIFAGYDLIMINCWAYWCGPCINEMPDLEQLHQAYPNLLLLGVSVDNDEPILVRRAVETTGVTYPILEPADDLETICTVSQYIPATFFLAPDGTLLCEEPYVGSKSYEAWAAIVEEYLG